MDQRARMFWTLASLAAAMIGTSAWLGWIDPSDPAPAQSPSFESQIASARSLVGDDPAIGRGAWRGIEVLAGPASSGGFLTARGGDVTHDFSIDTAGRLTRNTGWTTRGLSNADNMTIRIVVARRSRDDLMTRAQWYGLRALAAALREAAGDRSPLSVRLKATWADAYGLSPDTELVLNPPPPPPG